MIINTNFKLCIVDHLIQTFNFVLLIIKYKLLTLCRWSFNTNFNLRSMCWWKWRGILLHKLQPLWRRERRLRLRCWMYWRFKMWPRQWKWGQLWYFLGIPCWFWLLLWTKRLDTSKHLKDCIIVHNGRNDPCIRQWNRCTLVISAMIDHFS